MYLLLVNTSRNFSLRLGVKQILRWRGPVGSLQAMIMDHVNGLITQMKEEKQEKVHFFSVWEDGKCGKGNDQFSAFFPWSLPDGDQ